MKRKFHTPEQIVKKLREADAAVAIVLDISAKKVQVWFAGF